MPRKSITLNLKRNLVAPKEPPKPLHQLLFTRVGHDIQLDAGYFDMVELRPFVDQANETATELTFNVTDRFLITPTNAMQIYESLTAMVKDIRENNLLPEGYDGPGAEPTTEETPGEH